MLIKEIIHADKTHEVPFYHYQDIDAEIVDNWKTIDSNDVGKYVGFDDGSQLYTKIIGQAGLIVRTESGVYRKDEIVHIAIPKYKHANYSGAISRDEHLKIRPATKTEKALSTRLMNGEELKFVTNRVKMYTLEAIAKELGDELTFDGTNLAKHTAKGLYRISKGNGMPALKALQMLNVVHGVDIEKIPDKPQDEGNKALFAGINKGEIPRPSKKDITDIVASLKAKSKAEADLANVVSEVVNEG